MDRENNCVHSGCEDKIADVDGDDLGSLEINNALNIHCNVSITLSYKRVII